MKITILPPIPPFMFDRFTSFETNFNGKSWGDLYEAIYTLKTHHPDKIFKEAPVNYVDISNKTSGLIFVEEMSEDLYYVHR